MRVERRGGVGRSVSIPDILPGEVVHAIRIATPAHRVFMLLEIRRFH